MRSLRRECGCYVESAVVTKVRSLRKYCRCLAQSVAKTEHMFIGSDDNLNRIINASLIHIDGLAIN